ncbi:MAG: oxygen-independent coproporphyrinogen III oxidase [Pseudomonadaceae bacterium]|nr:oxygen-independent coproporphyrinogen III oxidase [Pseudomonadaceae bacterium]
MTQVCISPATDGGLLARYDRPVPRYTSYPTAPHFHEGVGVSAVAGWLAELPADKPVSVYLHTPYCKSMCLYCGCNMKVTHNPQVVSNYVSYLIREMGHVARLIGTKLKVSTVHLGGGTPSYLPPHALELLFDALHGHFDVQDGAEISMEADPRTLGPEMIVTMGRLGFNRVSLGVQDTNPTVQGYIGRIQPHKLNVAAVQGLRAAGIGAINLDMVYGLPGQTTESFRQTIQDVLELAPSRIAMFGYAHVPWMKRHQVVLEQYPRADSAERLEMFAMAGDMLAEHGYVPVGLDHFALPDDPLAVAAGNGTLHRNFMGYTTDDAETLLGFGASSISSYPQGYAQNVTEVKDYLQRVGDGILPVAKGIALTPRDRLARRLIEDISCNFACDTEAAVQSTGVDDAAYLAKARENLAPLMADGLVAVDGGRVCINPQGKPFTRVVAACFDDYLGKGSGRHSAAV